MFLVAVAVGLVFGGADQYVGSINATGLWTISLSMLSAPWLVLPFAFGCSQLRARRAAAVGLVATMSALAGYFLMIIGPFEGGQWTVNLREIHGLLFSNAPNLIGGLVTAPLYGVLGQRWRTRRAWTSAALVAGALCLEPLALTLAGRSYPGDAVVWPAEAGVGIAVAICFIAMGVAFRRRADAGLGKNAVV
ncbi:MAG: hypothetical protein ABR925_03155 [Acidimicrobiales bacterium]